MTRVSGLGFLNFRVFNNLTVFDLAPISIFTGTNSSGKSSIFKGLKLLNNNADDLIFLNFSGEGHKLGTFQLAKSRNSDSDVIRFILGFNNEFLFVIDYGNSKSGNKEGGYFQQCFATIGTEVKEKYKDEELLWRVWYEDPFDFLKSYINLEHYRKTLLEEILAPESIELKIVRKSLLDARKNYVDGWGGLIISPDKLAQIIPCLDSEKAIQIAAELDRYILKKNSYSEIDPMEADFIVKSKTFTRVLEELKPDLSLKISCRNFFESNRVVLDPGLIYQLGDSSVFQIVNDTFLEALKEKVESTLTSNNREIKNTVSQIHYIESVRANSQRLYSNQSQGTTFNALLLQMDGFWSREKDEGGNQTLKFADKWLKKFDIGDRILISRIKGIATEVIIERDGEAVDLIDLGYGVTQFIPILLYICSNFQKKSDYMTISDESMFDSEEDNAGTEDEDIEPFNGDFLDFGGPLLLIEEPESNLHPKLQSLLADFFIDVAQTFEVTLLIETHSEYLIRRLQVLTAAGKMGSAESVIYYLNGKERSNSENFVTKINIKSDGALTEEFGPGFIDEATNWKMELMRLKNSSKRNNN